MELNNSPTQSTQTFEYTFFIVNATFVVFFSFIYGFAHRFLRDKFYQFIAFGWLLNAIYLGVETYTKFFLNSSNNETTNVIPEYLKLSISLLSTIIFHYAIFIDSEFIHAAKYNK